MDKNKKIIRDMCADFDARYLDFELSGQKPSTWVIDVLTKDEIIESGVTSHRVHLGQIKWYAQWRQYAFYPESGTVFEKICLRDINRFVILMNAQQTKGTKPSPAQRKLFA